MSVGLFLCDMYIPMVLSIFLCSWFFYVGPDPIPAVGSLGGLCSEFALITAPILMSWHMLAGLRASLFGVLLSEPTLGLAFDFYTFASRKVTVVPDEVGVAGYFFVGLVFGLGVRPVIYCNSRWVVCGKWGVECDEGEC